MDRRNLAFDKVNFILLAIGMAIVILGFLLMSGAGSNENTFDMDIFSTRRIVVAPTVTLIGFLSIIYAVIRKPIHDECNCIDAQKIVGEATV